MNGPLEATLDVDPVKIRRSPADVRAGPELGPRAARRLTPATRPSNDPDPLRDHE
jgi:hypothetical protein